MSKDYILEIKLRVMFNVSAMIIFDFFFFYGTALDLFESLASRSSLCNDAFGI